MKSSNGQSRLRGKAASNHGRGATPLVPWMFVVERWQLYAVEVEIAAGVPRRPKSDPMQQGAGKGGLKEPAAHEAADQRRRAPPLMARAGQAG